MDKCEWKEELIDGTPVKFVKVGLRFYPCDSFEPEARSPVNDMGYHVVCKGCRRLIDKPEPEKPLIVKSGGTWVAHWKGVDYLDTIINRTKDQLFFFDSGKKVISNWKPFSEITLDDEIAKLRPMIIRKNGVEQHILCAIDNTDRVILRLGRSMDSNLYRLATAKEL